MTQQLILLHTNDIHGSVEGLARIAAEVERTRAANPDTPVLYLDAGDVEESVNRLSNLTRGAAMHRLLDAAGCDAAAVGNGGLSRYGWRVLADYAAAARYPLLLANLRTREGDLIPGTLATYVIEAGDLRLGVIGVTAPFEPPYESLYGLKLLPVLPLVRELALSLRQDGADAVILLSHLGYDADRDLARGVQELVQIIVGGHSHSLLPEGERVGDVFIAQAGEYGQQVGMIRLAWDGERLDVVRAAVHPVPEGAPPSARVLAEMDAIRQEVERDLNVVIGELAEALDYSETRECGMANLAADALRAYMHADVGVVAAGHVATGGLPAGPVTRLALWDASYQTTNPGVAALTGAQLASMVALGLDPVITEDRPRSLRGQACGLLHLSGASLREGVLTVGEKPVEPERVYRVAATDWELEGYIRVPYLDPAWGIRAEYDMPTILRDAIEAYLRDHRPARVPMGRLGRGSSKL